MKRKLMILGLSGTLLGAGLVGAQTGQSGGAAQDAQAQTQITDQTTDATTDETTARRSTRLAHLLLGRPLTLGSTLNMTFYDGNPEAGGSELQTLTFVYGEDSEAAFAQELTTAATEASYVTVTTSPQTQTYNLDEVGTFLRGGFGRNGRGPGGDFDSFSGFGGPGRHH